MPLAQRMIVARLLDGRVGAVVSSADVAIGQPEQLVGVTVAHRRPARRPAPASRVSLYSAEMVATSNTVWFAEPTVVGRSRATSSSWAASASQSAPTSSRRNAQSSVASHHAAQLSKASLEADELGGVLLLDGVAGRFVRGVEHHRPHPVGEQGGVAATEVRAVRDAEVS